MTAQWFNSFYWPDSTPRAFTEEQKKIILQKQESICAGLNCDKKLDITNFEILILRNYVEGGLARNCKGIALCKSCHDKMTLPQHNDWLELCL